ncbi:MAG: nitrogenase cofactor biosynthesis protein NifB [Chthoniobacteraceae bacterium]|nr:nitrogenase cofactor biosynthesis protein NifB [Chthoniobacteraceae bacterium]
MSDIDFSSHPCFSRDAHHKFGRIHLPIAPRCNIQCNFCNRKFDCMNESRPGVTSNILKPRQAAEYLAEVVSQRPEIKVVGIAGPGDPFANPVETMETLRLVRERFPEMILCLASNGLGIGPYIDELAELKVSHVTITITAVDPKIGAKIYAWIRDGKSPIRGEEAARILIERQLDAVRRLKERGIVVKVNAIIVPGVNDEHIPEIAKVVGPMGVDIMNCMPLVPVAGAIFEDLPVPDATMTARVRLQCGLHVEQMIHCARCRADAVGFIDEKMSREQMATLDRFAHSALNAGKARPYVAAASREGALVNMHLGEAASILIFKQDETTASGFKFVEIRTAPAPGGASARWSGLADLLADCRAFLVNAAGPSPKAALEDRGIEVIEMEGLIEEGLAAVFADQPIPASLKRRFTSCGEGGCRGTGTGCA